MRVIRIDLKKVLHGGLLVLTGMCLSVGLLRCVFAENADVALEFFNVSPSVNLTQSDTSSISKDAEKQTENAYEPHFVTATEATQAAAEYEQEKQDSLQTYETPADVFDMEEEYLAAFSQMNSSGDVVEGDFSTAGATDYISFSAIRNETLQQPDFESLLQQGPVFENPDSSEPLVLVFHTHTSETYLLSDNGVFWNDYITHTDQEAQNMLRVGEELVNTLRQHGIGVIHDTTVYDTDYTTAYAESRQGIEEILAQYPSIEIVLDVHRDAFYYSETSRGKPMVEIDGKKAAQIMIITGVEEGGITDFPDWEYNLRFALSLQDTASELYPGLMRPLYFCQRKYNMDVSHNSVLLEIGSDANTLDEALYAAHLCADALAKVVENSK